MFDSWTAWVLLTAGFVVGVTAGAFWGIRFYKNWHTQEWWKRYLFSACDKAKPRKLAKCLKLGDLTPEEEASGAIPKYEHFDLSWRDKDHRTPLNALIDLGGRYIDETVIEMMKLLLSQPGASSHLLTPKNNREAHELNSQYHDDPLARMIQVDAPPDAVDALCEHYTLIAGFERAIRMVNSKYKDHRHTRNVYLSTIEKYYVIALDVQSAKFEQLRLRRTPVVRPITSKRRS